MQLKVRIGKILKPEAGRLLLSGLAVLLCLTLPAPGGENDHEILNRLYREIISSAPAGISVTMDSVRPDAGSSVVSPAAGARTDDPTNEQLKNEIEKLVQEAETRHNGALKFMQDSR
jgi:hypothetical protein